MCKSNFCNHVRLGGSILTLLYIKGSIFKIENLRVYLQLSPCFNRGDNLYTFGILSLLDSTFLKVNVT